MKRVLNIIVSIIDNFGDIGFACELIRALEREYPDTFLFHLWSEDHPSIDLFLETNKYILPEIWKQSIADFENHQGNVTLLLFHQDIPTPSAGKIKKELFIRLDYLSFDAKWVDNHGMLHIASNEHRTIRECIPSPLPHGGGLLMTELVSTLRRGDLAQKYDIPEEKEWISLFLYPDSWRYLNAEIVPENTILLGLGGGKYPSTVLSLPFLSLTEFESCIRESKWAIVRGEVSFISSLQNKTPLFWNMYHDRGGFPHDQAKDFLTWIDRDDVYGDIFYRLNGQKREPTSVAEIDAYFMTHTWKLPGYEKNLVREIQKYIDSFDFSL